MSNSEQLKMPPHTPQRARQRVSSSSSLLPQAPSSSSGAASSSSHLDSDPLDSPKAAAAHWQGDLSEVDLERLRADFGEVFLCPSSSTRILHRADKFGRLVIPGSSKGYAAVREVFVEWELRAEEQMGWLPKAVEGGLLEPIKVKDLLSGLQKDRWTGYSEAHTKLRKGHARMLKREEVRLREVVKGAAQQGGSSGAATSAAQQSYPAASSSSSSAQPPL